MSTTIDNRVVEMRFDNQHFEKNVQTSISTLDKLKQKLNLTGASKGLEQIDKAARGTNIAHLGTSALEVGKKFSTMEIMGITSIANITNSAVNAGKRMVKALTIDPVTSGWHEYELKMGSVQTIMASTGESLDTVNKYLNELNEYSDKTIYSFSDMTQNIGKFTNAGVKLEDAVMAMKGISNEAALSGANANEASRAMYNFAQALSAGYVKLIDWKSIELANMATVGFKEQLLEAAVAAGTLTRAGDGLYKTLEGNIVSTTKNFNESLQDQWMTTDVLVSTLKDYADETTDIGKKATKAATEVKTFSMMMDALKESAQSGWARTWEIIFGNFEQGKNLWTSINEAVDKMIGGMSKVRNDLLESALGKSFTGLMSEIKDITTPIEKSANSIKSVVDSVQDYGKVVDEIIGGNWGTGQDRWNKLTQAGYDWAHAQNLVNEKLGSSKRYVSDYTKEQDKIIKTQNKVIDNNDEYIESLVKMSDEQLKEVGYTNKQIKAFRELEKQAKKTGIPLKDFIENIESIDGRYLLINSFKNIGKAISEVFTVIKKAWEDIFPPKSLEERANGLYNIIAALHKFTANIGDFIYENGQLNSTGEKLRDTFKGLFSILHIVMTIAGGGLKLAFSILVKLLDAMDMTILDFTSTLGKSISKFHDFIFNNKLISGAFELVGNAITKATEAISNFFDSLSTNPVIQELMTTFSDLWKNLFGDADTSDETKEIVSDINEVSNALSVHDKAVSNFSSIIKGVLAGVDISWSLASMSLMGFLRILNEVLKILGTDLGKGLTYIADIISEINAQIEGGTMFGSASKYYKIAKAILEIAYGIRDCVKEFFELDALKGLFDWIKNTFNDVFNAFTGFDTFSLDNVLNTIAAVFDKIQNWISGLNDSKAFNAGVDIVKGLANGIKSAIGSALEAIGSLAKSVIEWFNSILGIESPSTVFIAIGGYIIAGLVIGLTQGFGEIGSTMSDLASKFVEGGSNLIEGLTNGLKTAFGKVYTILEPFITNVSKFLGNIDFGAVFALILGGVVLKVFKSLAIAFDKLGNAIGAFTAPFTGLGKMFESMAGGITNISLALVKLEKAVTLNVKAKAIKNLAIAIGILAASVIAITLVAGDNPTKLWHAVGIILALAAILAVLAIALNKISESSISIENGALKASGGLKAGLFAIGGCLLLLAATVKIVGSMNPEAAKQGFLGLAMMVAAIGALVMAIEYLSKDIDLQNIHRVGQMMFKISVALLLMAAVMKITGSLSQTELDNGVAVITFFGVFIAALVMIVKGSEWYIAEVGSMMLKISFALLLLVGVIKLAGTLQKEELGKGLVVVILFGVFIAALIEMVKGVEHDVYKMGGVILAISAAMILMGICIKLIGGMKFTEIVKGSLAVLVFASIIALLINVLKTVEKDVPKMALTLIGISVALGIMAGTAIIMSLISIPGLIKGVLAVGLLGLVLAAMIKATRGASDIKGTMMGMAVAIGVMAASVAVLSLIPADKLKRAVLGLSAVMLSFAMMEKSAKGLNAKAIAPIILMGVLVFTLSKIIKSMSDLPVESALSSTASLSILLLSMSTSMTILSKIKTVSPMALAAVGVMTAVVLGLSLALRMLKDLPVESALGSASALSILLLAMTVAVGILASVKTVSPMALAAVGVMTVIVVLLGSMLKDLKDLPVEGTLSTAISLSTLILALSGACVLLKVAGLAGPAALWGVAALLAVIAGIGSLVIAVGYLMDKIPDLEKFLDKGIPVIGKIGTALGTFFGGVVGSFAESSTDGLSAMAKNLSDFMTNLQGFISGASNISEESLAGVRSLVEMIGMLTKANIIESIGVFISGNSSMEMFASQLDAFADAITSFSSKVTGKIDEKSITAAANVGKLLAEMQNMTASTNGVKQFFTGQKDLGTFGEQLKLYGQAIVDFSSIVSKEGVLNENAVAAAANAGKLMAEMQNDIAAIGGVAQFFKGDKDLSNFGTQLKSYGQAIVDFSSIVSSEGAINENAILAAANAGKIMSELQTTLEPLGGVIDWFVGSVDLDDFGVSLEKYGTSIAAFSKSVTGENAIDESAITAAANVGKLMTEIQASIPKNKLFDGQEGLDSLGEDIRAFGLDIAAYSNSVSGIDSGAVSTSITAIQRIVSSIKSMSDLDTSGVTAFKTALNELGNTSISSFVSAFNTSTDQLISIGSGMIDAVIKGLTSGRTKIIAAVAVMMSSINSAVASGVSRINISGDAIMSGLIKSLQSGQSKVNSLMINIISNMAKIASDRAILFGVAGQVIMNNLANGIKAQSSSVSNAVTSTLTTAVSSISSYYTKFYSAGSNLVTGFVNGIKFNAFKAATAARAMANAAEKAAKDALDINSPSKVFRKIGAGIPEGFVQGIGMFGNLVSGSVESMADNAINSTKGVMSRIAEAINTDIDSQPTIRPVLDLSDVKSGAGMIGNLLGQDTSVYARANVGAISSMMSTNNQNGFGSEIVSAIDKLRNDLGSIGNTTYTINGITYDDGTNVSNAVQTLVRAAKMERRI